MDTPENNSTYIPIEGMDSEHCALIIDKGLASVEGVTSHKVELNNNRVLIESNQLTNAIIKTVQTIRSLGYDVPTVKKNFPVLNMTCASCAKSSQTILSNQPGVISAAV